MEAAANSKAKRVCREYLPPNMSFLLVTYLKKIRIIVGDIPVEFGGILWVHLPCTFRRLTVEALGTSTLIVPISAN
jgi:hypothetical protein